MNTSKCSQKQRKGIEKMFYHNMIYPTCLEEDPIYQYCRFIGGECDGEVFLVDIRLKYCRMFGKTLIEGERYTLIEYTRGLLVNPMNLLSIIFYYAGSKEEAERRMLTHFGDVQ
jgi:hypothetical protein